MPKSAKGHPTPSSSHIFLRKDNLSVQTMYVLYVHTALVVHTLCWCLDTRLCLNGLNGTTVNGRVVYAERCFTSEVLHSTEKYLCQVLAQQVAQQILQTLVVNLVAIFIMVVMLVALRYGAYIQHVRGNHNIHRKKQPWVARSQMPVTVYLREHCAHGL